jgi:hypothetical protein
MGLRLRHVSGLPIAREGVGRVDEARRAMTYSVKEMFYTLQGEGARTFP